MAARVDIPKDKLIDAYYNQQLSLRATANLLGVGETAVIGNMKRYGLKTRDLSESHKGQHSSPKTQFKSGGEPTVNGFDIIRQKKRKNGAVDSELLMIGLLKKNNLTGYTREYKVFTGDGGLGGRRFYAIDFAWKYQKIAVEVDGNSHDKRTRKRDKRKDVYLKSKGWQVLRFSEHKIKARSDEVITELRRCLS